MKIFGLVGRSGSGKTSLMVRLLPEIKRRGLTVSTIKHAHHGFDLDHPGKDSFRHREAGAKEVMLVADARWALMHEIGDAREPPLEELVRRMARVDFVLIEGFHTHGHPVIEVYRPQRGARADVAPGLDHRRRRERRGIAGSDGSGARSQRRRRRSRRSRWRTRRPSYDDAARRSSGGSPRPRRRVWSIRSAGRSPMSGCR